MSNKELLTKFKTAFAAMKKELGFSATLEELEDIFFFEDFIIKEGYVSSKLSRALCRRMVETYFYWLNYLHGLVMPNPGYMVGMAEAQAFSQEEKDHLITIMNRIMAHTTVNNLVGMTKDKKMEGEFFDNSLALWKELLPEFTKVNIKLVEMWAEKVKKK